MDIIESYNEIGQGFTSKSSIIEQHKRKAYEDASAIGDISWKLKILTDAAKYDVACTSSGVERKGNGGDMGNAAACGICHAFAADGRCISLLKILMSNECVFDCKYCINRKSNDVPRATFTADEICRLTMEFYRRNYIEGLFLSSGVVGNPNQTTELMYEAIRKLRVEYRFNGYIHVKAIPGAAQELVEAIGYLTDRMSINLEMPTSEGLKTMAPHKTRSTILKPMKEIQVGIHNNRLTHGLRDKRIPMQISNCTAEVYKKTLALPKKSVDLLADGENTTSGTNYVAEAKQDYIVGTRGKYFVPAGQSTQMIIGATPESDYHIINVAQALYDNYDLKRVFYSAYIPINEDSNLPSLDTKPPLLREHRLYQADWLLRFYGFKAEELLSEERPFFNEKIDPKCDWAVRHLEQFPVEINTADISVLLRVPGIGMKSAKRIVLARRYGSIDFNDLKRMGVVLKRALYFITCKGKMMYSTKIEENYIVNHLVYNEPPEKLFKTDNTGYQQLSLFDVGSPLLMSSG